MKNDLYLKEEREKEEEYFFKYDCECGNLDTGVDVWNRNFVFCWKERNN